MLVDGDDGEPKGFEAGGAPGMKMWEWVARRGLLGAISISDGRLGVSAPEVGADEKAEEEDGGEDNRGNGIAKFVGAFLLAS